MSWFVDYMFHTICNCLQKKRTLVNLTNLRFQISSPIQIFAEWRKEEVTTAVFEYLKALRADRLQYLEFNAGKDPLEDRFSAGVLAGINEVLNMSAQDVVDDETDQE